MGVLGEGVLSRSELSRELADGVVKTLEFANVFPTAFAGLVKADARAPLFRVVPGVLTSGNFDCAGAGRRACGGSTPFIFCFLFLFKLLFFLGACQEKDLCNWN